LRGEVTLAEQRPIRIAVIGCGTIASWYHIPVLRGTRGAALVAVAETDPGRRVAAGRLARTAAYHDLRELLAKADVDAVVISTPPQLHAELAVAAARAGKHVFVEKPIATSEADARWVLDEVVRSGVTAAIGFNRRLHPLFEQARALLADAAVGTVHRVLTAFCEPVEPGEMPAWKRSRSTGGGALLDLASHHFDLLRWFLAEEIEVVDAATTSDVSEHDGASTRLASASGVEVQSFFSLRAAHADFLELIGERGTLRVDRHRAALEWRVPRRIGYGVCRRRPRPGRDVIVWRMRRRLPGAGEPSYGRLLRGFVQRLRGAPVELPSLEDGLRSLLVVLEAERLALAASGELDAHPARH
jgi:myo-inositol 2-dehydrogenase / D-chiro-inositol 1-dehydrogenase